VKKYISLQNFPTNSTANLEKFEIFIFWSHFTIFISESDTDRFVHQTNYVFVSC
jgi:hypothetical protein